MATDDDGTCPEDFNGNDPRNIMNRLAANGIQIEQSRDASNDYHDKIAKAVADVIDPKIKACTAPVFAG